MITKRCKLFFLIFTFLLLVIVTIACKNNSETSESKGNTAKTEAQPNQPLPDTAEPVAMSDTPVPTAIEDPMPEMYLGDAVSADGYALTAISVQDPATPGGFYTAESGKKLVAVEVIISNISGDILHIDPIYASLVDNEGIVHKIEFPGVDYPLEDLDLNPGEKVKGLIAFKVPEKTVVDSIKYRVESLDKYLQASLKPAPAGHVAVLEPPTTPGSPLPKLGEVVEYYGYTLSAIDVQDPSTRAMLYYAPRQGCRLVAVEIVVANVSGSETLEVNPLFAFLVDENGFVYTAVLGGLEGQISPGELSPGAETKGWVAFTIPENATLASIKYMINEYEGNYLQIGLIK